jgi:hypothetical protein
MVDGAYDENEYVLDAMISKQQRRLVGREELRSAEYALLERLPYRETYVARLVHDGNAAAVWHPVVSRTAPSAPILTYSSLMVLTVGSSGRFVSEHTYLPAAWRTLATT